MRVDSLILFLPGAPTVDFCTTILNRYGYDLSFLRRFVFIVRRYLRWPTTHPTSRQPPTLDNWMERLFYHLLAENTQITKNKPNDVSIGNCYVLLKS